MDKFLMKLLLNGIIVVPLLVWFTEATFIQALVTAVVLSIIAYFAGDQMILRASNNITASVADVLLTLAYLWVVVELMDWSMSLTELITISLLIGVVEFVFHRIIGTERAR